MAFKPRHGGVKFSDPRPTAVCDTECLPNYWSILFRDVETGRIKKIRKMDDEPLDRKAIAATLKRYRVAMFNSRNYDEQMIALAMSGASNTVLKQASDAIIADGMRPWEFYNHYNIDRIPQWADIIDMAEVSPGSPGKPSLKLSGARLHSRKIMEMPIPHYEPITHSNINTLYEYEDNDLFLTHDMWRELEPQIRLRSIMSDEYNTDLRSKSDAQMAEAVMLAELRRITGRDVPDATITPKKFKYQIPDYIKFKTPAMKDLIEKLRHADFRIDYAGQVHEPDFLKKMPLPLGDVVYTMGIGGLHSTEKAQFFTEDLEWLLLDRDVTSYYPSIILLLKLYPPHLGIAFLKVLRKLYDRRVHAKKMAGECTKKGDKEGARKWGDIAETLKIVLNGLFGKFGSPFSKLFAPELMVQTTLTGQLSVLMLIEDLVLRDMTVVSANTDGFVTRVHADRRDEFNALLMEWEWDTGLKTEETQYKWLYSANVNNYIALDKDDKIKRKGKSATPAGPGQKGASGLKKNPWAEICIDAVIAFLKDNTPIEDTVHHCEDIRKFVAVTRVTGKDVVAMKEGETVGRSIRFYFSTDTTTGFTRSDTGAQIAGTRGGMPMLEFPKEFSGADDIPDDIDYDWYIREAYAVLQSYGVPVIDPKFKGRTGTFTGLMDKQKTYHVVNLPNCVAVCGKQPKSIRETWEEVKRPNGTYKFCSKCLKGGEI